MGLPVIEHPGFLEAQPVAGRSAHHRDVVQRGVDRRHHRLFAPAQPVDQQQAEAILSRGFRRTSRQFLPQLGPGPAAVVNAEIAEVGKGPRDDGEILRAESEGDDAIVAPAVGGEFSGGGAAEDRRRAQQSGYFGDKFMGVVIG